MQTYDNEGPPLAPSGDFGFAGDSRWRTMPCTFCLPFCLLCRGKKVLPLQQHSHASRYLCVLPNMTELEAHPTSLMLTGISPPCMVHE